MENAAEKPRKRQKSDKKNTNEAKPIEGVGGTNVMPPLPSMGSTITAFDYLKNPYFFVGQGAHNDFLKQSNDWRLRHVTLYVYFNEARVEAQKRKGEETLLVEFGTIGCHAAKVMEAYRQWNESYPIEDAGRTNVMPPLPSMGSTITAFDYLKNPYFFLSQGAHNDFLKQSNDWRLRHVTLHVYFNEARVEAQKTKGVATLLVEFGTIGCDAVKVMEAYRQWNKANPMEGLGILSSPRMVSVGYEIQNTKLSHNYDLDCFSERVDELFKWYAINDVNKKFVGPYLCFVQSSGMGKTKLMYHYKEAKSTDKDVAAFLVLPLFVNFKIASEKDVFDFHVDLEALVKAVDQDPAVADPTAAKSVAISIYDKLNTQLEEIIRREKDCKKVVLLFDESHCLLTKNFGVEAFLFRCVRLWLREERGLPNVVGVFAGTNSRLANFLVESDNQFESGMEPSRTQKHDGKKYHPKGFKFNPPFYQTNTMGSCKSSLTGDSFVCEYDRAVYYGRPLFALMAKKGELDSTISIPLHRMLLIDEKVDEWHLNRNAWINMLSTRIQMGQTTIAVTSDLVAKAYANLTGCFDETKAAQLGYLLDPVCARLAMCMMDEHVTCELKNISNVVIGNVQGKNKKWWTTKLKEIFSSGIVSPDKGDFGEVVVALYMLFCGDLLRKEINDNRNKIDNEVKTQQAYIQFSVVLDDWLQLLHLGGKLHRLKRHRQEAATPMADDECEMSVGFIQVCRNSLRSYGKTWKGLGDQIFLKSLYESGSAFYVFPGCPLIDMVIPLRVKMEKGKSAYLFVPMVVSIKCRLSFTNKQAKAICDNMKEKATEGGLGKALCLLISFGSEDSSNPFEGDIVLQEAERVSLKIINNVVTKAIRVPDCDVFGLSEAFNAMTPIAQVNTELFASHPFLKMHRVDCDDLQPSNAMRATSSSVLKRMFSAMLEALHK